MRSIRRSSPSPAAITRLRLRARLVSICPARQAWLGVGGISGDGGGCCPDRRRTFASSALRREDHPKQQQNQDGPSPPKRPFRFDTGFALFAKRTPRPFPPPFNSPPSVSFSDPLSTHNMSRDRRAYLGSELIRGYTSGDDAVYASDHFICANDGVGAWAARPRGHAGLWSRLIIHFWTAEIDEAWRRHGGQGDLYKPDPVAALQTAYEKTVEAAGEYDWQGTTTACGAQLHFVSPESSTLAEPLPLLYVTNLGDCQIMVLRPTTKEVIYKTKEQWHWFDCPRQLGTNSPDTPKENAVMDTVEMEVGDVVLAMSDGVIDNLWEHEIVDTVVKAMQHWEESNSSITKDKADRIGGRNGGMKAAAQELVAAAKHIAMDPFAESPYMEHAIEEGLASEGGKLDDISVVAAVCVKDDA